MAESAKVEVTDDGDGDVTSEASVRVIVNDGGGGDVRYGKAGGGDGGGDVGGTAAEGDGWLPRGLCVEE